MIARRADAEPADGKAWIDGKSCLCSGPRLIQRSAQRERGSKPKMRKRKISVAFNGAKEPADCFIV
jgi:hypothetical protein